VYSLYFALCYSVQVRTIDEKPLYLQVADSVADLINAGSLRSGDRVPSVRRLSGQQNVSVPTVLQAYMVLENRRMIEARPKSGFFVKPRLSESLAEPAVSGKTSAVPWADFHPSTPIIRDLVDPSLVPSGRRHSQSGPPSGSQAGEDRGQPGAGAHSGDHQLRPRTRFPDAAARD
jgi:DNA-binding transcriptional regulator YhcF (GntR family)